MYDIRDDKPYTVRKLADGNCWMTDNLYLVKTMTLTSANSNVTSNYAITGISGTAAMEDDKAYDTGNASYGAFYNQNTALAQGAGDICPMGWRIPSIESSTNEFQNLYTKYNTSALMRNTIYGPGFVLAGRRLGGSSAVVGSYGYYWSNSSTFHLRIGDDGTVITDAQLSPSYGFSVRCLAK